MSIFSAIQWIQKTIEVFSYVFKPSGINFGLLKWFVFQLRYILTVGLIDFAQSMSSQVNVMTWDLESKLVNFLIKFNQSKNSAPLHSVILLANRFSLVELLFVDKIFVVIPVALRWTNYSIGAVVVFVDIWFIKVLWSNAFVELNGTLNYHVSTFWDTFRVT